MDSGSQGQVSQTVTAFHSRRCRPVCLKRRRGGLVTVTQWHLEHTRCAPLGEVIRAPLLQREQSSPDFGPVSLALEFMSS